jgi:methionyl-tRNA formyltransferase
MIRIWFFGTPTLSARVLEDILSSSGFEVVFVVTNPDKPFGRSWEMKGSAVKEVAIEHHLELLQPEKIRWNSEFFERLRGYHCDYFVVVAYGKILPLELLNIPKKMCINVHGSILPKYRWASPIQAALLHGETETWVTIMQMSEGMDEGDILKIRNIPIDSKETSESLFEKFATFSGPTLIQTLLELEHGGITPLPQDHASSTYCKKIEKEDGLVDWSKSAEDIYHMWQAYTPWPGIFTMFEGKRILLEITNQEWGITSTGTKWEVVRLDDGRIGMACGTWVLLLEQVKLEGKKSQHIHNFVNWQKWFIGYKTDHETGYNSTSDQ